jgi:hypothetical protein
MYREYADPWDAVVYEAKPVVWEKPTEYLKELRESVQEGPYYLMDYWGRHLASYADLDQAIRNAERNMYVSHIVASLTGDVYGGKTVWSKPETATTQASAMLPFSKRAALERLPIHHDPAMWTDEQLVEAIARPELFGNDQKRYQATVEQLAKRGLTKKIQSTEVGKWLEHGRFMLFWSGSPLAIYKTREHAQRAKGFLVKDFATQGKMPDFVDGGQMGWEGLIAGDISYEAGTTVGDHRAAPPLAKREVREQLLNPKANGKDRQDYADAALNIIKMPHTIDIPENDCSSGDRPDAKDSVVTRNVFQQDLRDLEGDENEDVGSPLYQGSRESVDKEKDGRRQFIEQAVKTVKKRLDAQRAGLDPDKLADDDWTDEDDVAEMTLLADDPPPLSHRAKIYQ